MKRLENDKEVLQDSKLFALNPFLDRNDDLIHVRGRIVNADVPKEMKEPIVLPAKNRITQLLIEDIHCNTGHVGVKHVVSKLRENYWVLRCVSEVKKVIGRCIFCRRQNKPLQSQLMAPLPEERLVADRPPFDSTGIDYFGPLMVRVGRSSVKRWAVIFTCMSCRAVHFEVSHMLDTDSFLAAFSRFTARRGTLTTVFSDNGTNLVAAEKELQDMLKALERGHDQTPQALR